MREEIPQSSFWPLFWEIYGQSWDFGPTSRYIWSWSSFFRAADWTLTNRWIPLRLKMENKRLYKTTQQESREFEKIQSMLSSLNLPWLSMKWTQTAAWSPSVTISELAITLLLSSAVKGKHSKHCQFWENLQGQLEQWAKSEKACQRGPPWYVQHRRLGTAERQVNRILVLSRWYMCSVAMSSQVVEKDRGLLQNERNDERAPSRAAFRSLSPTRSCYGFCSCCWCNSAFRWPFERASKRLVDL